MSGKSTVRIGTHDKFFHCSEVLACVLLKLLPEYKDAYIERSRDQSVLNTCNILVGVGGEYDPSRYRYDHHVRGFNASVRSIINKSGYEWNSRLSSAGLIYCHFGHKILRSVLSDVTEDKVIEIFKIIYDALIKEIDSADNDKELYESSYRSSTDLSGRVNRLNPPWDSPDLEFNEQFENAMALVQKEFFGFVEYAQNIRIPLRDTVRRAVESRFKVDSSEEIILFSQVVPWKEYLFHLFQLKKEMNVSPSIKYVIYKYATRPYTENFYWIECISGAHTTGGDLYFDALVEACGIEGNVHSNRPRHIGPYETEDGAITIVRKALKIWKDNQKAARARKPDADNDSRNAKRRA